MANTPVPSSTQNVYVGARYIPQYFGEWSATEAYEPLSMVTYNADLYISVMPVTAGITPANNDFWVMFSAASPDLTALTEQVNKNTNDISVLKQINDLTQPKITKLTDDVKANTAAIATNTADITALKASVGSDGGAWKLASSYGILPNGQDMSAKISELSAMTDTNIIFPAGEYLIENFTSCEVACFICPGATFQLKGASIDIQFFDAFLAGPYNIFTSEDDTHTVTFTHLPGGVIEGRWFENLPGTAFYSTFTSTPDYPLTLNCLHSWFIKDMQLEIAHPHTYPLIFEGNGMQWRNTNAGQAMWITTEEQAKIIIKNMNIINGIPDTTVPQGYAPFYQATAENVHVEFENITLTQCALCTVPFSVTGVITSFKYLSAHNIKVGVREQWAAIYGSGREAENCHVWDDVLDQNSPKLPAANLNPGTSVDSQRAVAGLWENISFLMNRRQNLTYTFNGGTFKNCEFDVQDTTSVTIAREYNASNTALFQQCSFNPNLKWSDIHGPLTFMDCYWEEQTLSGAAVVGTLNGAAQNDSTPTIGFGTGSPASPVSEQIGASLGYNTTRSQHATQGLCGFSFYYNHKRVPINEYTISNTYGEYWPATNGTMQGLSISTASSSANSSYIVTSNTYPTGNGIYKIMLTITYKNKNYNCCFYELQAG